VKLRLLRHAHRHEIGLTANQTLQQFALALDPAPFRGH
jgi:hypothetical protein